MHAFASLYQRLDRSTSLLEKRAALIDYSRVAPIEDAVWALWLLTGGKVGGAKARIASSAELRQWVAQESGCRIGWWKPVMSRWVIWAETLALLLDDPAAVAVDMGLGQWIKQRLLPAGQRRRNSAGR